MAAKETIYIEADDEITAVIEKVISAKDKIVAVVLPKHATVFQSVVNMKLLTKAAGEVKKQVVIISSEPAIESIAAVAGVHLAKSLQSKPFIPKRSKKERSEVISSKELDDSSEDSNAEEMQVPEETIASDETEQDSESDTIELDNTDNEAVEVAAGTNADDKKKKKKLAFKIPDFSSFKLRMGLGIGLVILIIAGWFFGFVVMPKATVTINTDTSSSTVTFDFIADTAVTELNLESGAVPAIKVETTKQNTATVPTTGEKNIGEKATGIVTLTNCRPGGGFTVPAGTGFSKGNLTFVTVEDIELGPAVIIGSCRSSQFPNLTTPGAVRDVSVVASNSGEAYNIGTQSLDSSVSGVSAFGSDMVGGTTKVVKVVSADDIAKAKEQLSGTSTAEAISEMQKTLEDQQLKALAETVEEGAPSDNVSAAVDAEASEVTVTRTVSFSLFGVKNSDIGLLLDNRINASLEGSKDKNIRRNGLDTAVIRRVLVNSPTNQTLSLQTVAVIGPEFDEEAIRNEVAGKKRGDIEKQLETRDGVRSVVVEYSPLWITTTPKSAKKITIVINELDN